MKIVVLDGYTENPGDLSWDGFAEMGELAVHDRSPLDDPQEVIRRIGDAEAVLTNKTPLDRAVIGACPNLAYIGVLATGYNVVDIEAARKRGVPVTNTPAYGTEGVGQFAIALLLELCHHVGHHSDAVHAGRWTENLDFCFWDYPLISLSGKTLGVIGFGRIGQVTGKIAAAMGMRVLAHDAHPTEAGEALATYVPLDTLYAEADVIALHCPLFPETTGLINRGAIAKMKDGVLIINNARGPLINEADLAEALNSGKVAGAAVDVVSTEPILADNPLLFAKNCIITPHIAWAPKESRARLMEIAVDNMRQYLAGHPVNVVNS